MTSDLTNTADATRRKRLLYQCWHRGTREMDLILGRFANAHVGLMSTAELEALEQILPVPDPALMRWVTGEEEPADIYDRALILRIRRFIDEGGARPDET